MVSVIDFVLELVLGATLVMLFFPFYSWAQSDLFYEVGPCYKVGNSFYYYFLIGNRSLRSLTFFLLLFSC